MPSSIEQIQDGNTIESVVDSSGTITTSVSGDGSGVIGVTTLNELDDVDIITEGKQDGSVLVYDTVTNKWTSTLKLEKQLMNGGFF